MNVAILLWDGVDLLTFAGPAQVFSEAGDGSACYVYTVADSRYSIVSQNFLEITPEYALHECPRPEVVVIPAGGVVYVRQRQGLLHWLREAVQAARVILAVSPGDEILTAAGVLMHGEAETGMVEKVIVARDAPGAIEAAIQIVTRLCGEGVGRETARRMERCAGDSG